MIFKVANISSRKRKKKPPSHPPSTGEGSLFVKSNLCRLCRSSFVPFVEVVNCIRLYRVQVVTGIGQCEVFVLRVMHLFSKVSRRNLFVSWVIL